MDCQGKVNYRNLKLALMLVAGCALILGSACRNQVEPSATKPSNDKPQRKLSKPAARKVQQPETTQQSRIIDEIIEVLNDAPDHHDRQSAAYSAGKVVGNLRQADKERLTLALIEALDFERNMTVRGALIISLGRTQSRSAIESLSEQILDLGNHYRIREAAAQALGHSGLYDAVDPLIDCIQTDNVYQVRRAAIRAMAKVGGAGEVDFLNSVAEQDSHYRVRQEAKSAVWQIRSRN